MVRRVAAVQALVDVQFWFPLWLIFLLDRGVSLGTALLADGVFRLVSLAAEIPMGRLADWIGRKRAVLLVCIGSTVVFGLIALVNGAVSLFAVWIIWGLLWALTTGVVSSYLYEACRQQEIEPAPAFAAVRGCGAVAVLLSLALAGYLYAFASAVPFLLTSALALAAACVATSLPTVAVTRAPERCTTGQFLDLWRRDGFRLVWLTLCLLIAVGWSVRILFQPLALDLDMSSAAVGWFYTLFAAAGFTGHVSTAWVSRTHCAQSSLWCIVAISVASLGTAAVPAAAPWVLLPVMGFAYSFGTTTLELATHEYTPDNLRGTVLAGAGAASGIVIAIARPGLGWTSELVSVAGAFLLWGVITGAIAAGLAPAVRRAADSPTSRPASSPTVHP